MPEISLFYGIRITMYYNDHMPPHFHAEYNGNKALVDIINIGGEFMQDYFPTVVQVIPLDNFHVQVFFDDGKIIEYDAINDLQGDVFKPLQDIHVFKDTCTVLNGTLAWDLSGQRDTTSCIDIDPFTLYELESINHLIA